MVNFKGAHFQKDIILTCVRWYVAYPLSYRHLEEMMEERGVSVDHSTINRWVVKFTPRIEATFRRRKRPVGGSWLGCAKRAESPEDYQPSCSLSLAGSE